MAFIFFVEDPHCIPKYSTEYFLCP